MPGDDVRGRRTGNRPAPASETGFPRRTHHTIKAARKELDKTKKAIQKKRLRAYIKRNPEAVAPLLASEPEQLQDPSAERTDTDGAPVRAERAKGPKASKLQRLHKQAHAQQLDASKAAEERHQERQRRQEEVRKQKERRAKEKAVMLKRNRKGQPLMKGRVEKILQQLSQSA